MIKIKNSQKKISFDAKQYQTKAQKILTHLGYDDFDLGILLTTEKTIQKYNKDFRNKDKATDVLSFPYHTELKAGKKIKVLSEEDKNLGDIIIAVSYVFENKHSLDGDFNARMDRMLVHAICHLLGHDHIEDDEFKKMMTLENKLLKVIA
jgi:probable rRNA maturation factor